tara:strand:- start:44 stop:250 length:207 start_codon:yes stop_codon:yes gene_type:complete
MTLTELEDLMATLLQPIDYSGMQSLNCGQQGEGRSVGLGKAVLTEALDLLDHAVGVGAIDDEIESRMK